MIKVFPVHSGGMIGKGMTGMHVGTELTRESGRVWYSEVFKLGAVVKIEDNLAKIINRHPVERTTSYEELKELLEEIRAGVENLFEEKQDNVGGTR